MGSAKHQGDLWGRQARDYACFLEQVTLPLYGAALDAARVVPGMHLLDAGCGAGLLSFLATERGAHVSALDAAPSLLAITRRRLPDGDVQEGDLEALPYHDASFDAVLAVNSIFYAADVSAAMRELARVTRPGGRVVVTSWGPPDRCQFLAAVMPAIGPLMPPPPPGAPPRHPVLALAQPGALAMLIASSGLSVVEEGEVACPFVFADLETSWRANASAGPNQLAIAHSGVEAVRTVFDTVDRAHARPDGSVHYDNTFLWAVGQHD